MSIALLAWMLWLSLDRSLPEGVVSARSQNLEKAIQDWSVSSAAPGRIAVTLDSTPFPSTRDWLAALRGAGSEVSWSGELPAVAVSVQPIASPRGGFAVLASAPGGSVIRLADDVGPLDTTEARRGGASFTVPSATGTISAVSGGTTAKTVSPQDAIVRRVLVLGNAGWEAKFVAAALEEDGWKVDASLHVAPGVSVTQGSTAPIDTSRYSAVVALDASAASRAAEIVRYVAQGGGLLISGTAASVEGFVSLRAGAPARAEPTPALTSDAESRTLRSLAVVPVASLRPDAIAIERRGATVVAAARRHVAGRVLQQGYLDTWRWRMSGGETAVEDHRAWWTRAVASTAFVGSVRSDSETQSVLDNAPIARLVEALGPASSRSSFGLVGSRASVSLWWLFVLLSLCLLVEWASRRLRGVR